MIREECSFGADIGIASFGWAMLVDEMENAPRSITAGSWIFDSPEESDRSLKNANRRTCRLMRRTLKRRALRMQELRQLFSKHGLITSSDPDALAPKHVKHTKTPWQLRVEALDTRLEAQDFARAIFHIARRRGFKSGAKVKGENTSSDDSKMKASIEANTEKLAKWRTVGELYSKEPEFANRKRNRDGIYDRTGDRKQLADEIAALFKSQREKGATFATEELEASVQRIAGRQRPVGNSEQMVGYCAFEPEEKRSSVFAPSFELFRALCRLNNLSLRSDANQSPHRLTPEQVKKALSVAESQKSLTYKTLRKLLGLSLDTVFIGVKATDEKNDCISRSGSAFVGTVTICEALGYTEWSELTPEQRDELAQTITFFASELDIAKRLEELNFSPAVRTLISEAIQRGAFDAFKGAGNLSSKACRNIIPFLTTGLTYDKACAEVGYEHSASPMNAFPQVRNKADFKRLCEEVSIGTHSPVARKALLEGLKQIWALINEYGLPGRICVEMARDVGNSALKRKEIKDGIDEATRERKKERAEAAELLGLQADQINSDLLLKYRLWKEQNGRSIYSDKEIPPGLLRADDNTLQVDHILPWSRFGDDSYNNKTLCFAHENQEKKGRTPFEWFSEKPEERWLAFQAGVETNSTFRGFKKRNYLLRNAKEAEERFRSRNLNDTRYAARLFAEALKCFYPIGQRGEKGGRRRILTRPGALTSALRHAWGVENLKKDEDGKRKQDDRHHGLDAIIVAAVGDGEIQRLTRSYQQFEQRGQSRPLRNVDPPWPGFREDVMAAFDTMFVARPERRRARGQGHDATIKRIAEDDSGRIVVERIQVLQLGMHRNKFIRAKADAQLARIRDPDRNAPLVRAITDWLDAGRPMAPDELPRSPQGDVLRRIRLRSNDKPAVAVRGGTAGRGDMVRVDVFTKPNRTGVKEYFLVPIYRHQVMDLSQTVPPARIVTIGKKEEEWSLLEDQHQFKFSLYPRSYIELQKRNGEIKKGYFSGLDVSTSALNLYENHSKLAQIRSIGSKTLLSFSKYSVDRLGRKGLVRGEIRTWRGKPCTYHGPPG